MPTLYKENQFFFYSCEAIYAFRTIKLSRHLCDWFSYMVGRGPWTAAGRFYHITNLIIKAQGWVGEWGWLTNSISDSNGD
jgi:hypothetical protein